MRANIIYCLYFYLITTSAEDSDDASEEVTSYQLNGFTQEPMSNKDNATDTIKDFEYLANIEEQYQSIMKLKQTTIKLLKWKVAKSLSGILSEEQTSFQRQKFNDLYSNLLKHFQSTMIEEVVEASLKYLKSKKSPEELFDILCYVWQQCFPPASQLNDPSNFEMMLKSQLILYKLYETDSDVQDEYLLKLAYLLFKMRKNKSDLNTDLNVQSQLANISESLPDRLAIFKDNFCMMNAYSKEYIYTSVFYDVEPQSRYILLFREKTPMSVVEAVDIQRTSHDFRWKVILRGSLFKLYYYITDDSKTSVAGTTGINDPSVNYAWNLMFLENNKIVLSQRGLIMCAGSMHIGNLFKVNGFEYGNIYNENNPRCQWLIESCTQN